MQCNDVHAFVTSRVDYCNALYGGASKTINDNLKWLTYYYIVCSFHCCSRLDDYAIPPTTYRPPPSNSAESFICECKHDKKAVLSQRWPRNALYTCVPWKFSGLPDYANGYYSQHFSLAFVPIDPLNVPTKFEVRSFTCSWDNRRWPKNSDSPWIRPRSSFSKIFNGVLIGLAL